MRRHDTNLSVFGAWHARCFSSSVRRLGTLALLFSLGVATPACAGDASNDSPRQLLEVDGHASADAGHDAPSATDGHAADAPDARDAPVEHAPSTDAPPDVTSDTSRDAPDACTGADGCPCGDSLRYAGAGCDGTNRVCMFAGPRDASCENAWVCGCDGHSIQTCGIPGAQHAYETACLLAAGPTVIADCVGCPEHFSPLNNLFRRRCQPAALGQHCAYAGFFMGDDACAALGSGKAELLCTGDPTDPAWQDVTPTKLDAAADAPDGG